MTIYSGVRETTRIEEEGSRRMGQAASKTKPRLYKKRPRDRGKKKRKKSVRITGLVTTGNKKRKRTFSGKEGKAALSFL